MKQFWCNLCQWVLGGFVLVEIYCVGIGQNEQCVGVNLVGKQGGGQIFVDYCFDIVVVIGFFYDWYVVVVVIDNQVIVVNQCVDGIVFYNVFWLWGGYNVVEGVIVGFEYLVFFCL